jgi:hypothetical protein
MPSNVGFSRPLRFLEAFGEHVLGLALRFPADNPEWRTPKRGQARSHIRSVLRRKQPTVSLFA